MELQKKDYEVIYGFESFPGIGLQILIAESGIDFNSEEYMLSPASSEVRKAASAIEEALGRYAKAKDPEAVAYRKEARQKMLTCFPGDLIFVEEIPNGYCSRACCSQIPWFNVTTKKGVITIGWRKRVINISFPTSIGGTDPINGMFKGENTTIGSNYIHAWGYDKAKEYISKYLSL